MMYCGIKKFSACVIKILKRESRRLSKERNVEINNLYALLKVQSETRSLDCNIIKAEIDKYYEYKRKSAERRACELRNTFIFQPTKILLEKEQRRYVKNSIKKIQNGEWTCDRG